MSKSIEPQIVKKKISINLNKILKDENSVQ